MRQYDLTRKIVNTKLEQLPKELRPWFLSVFKAGFTLGQLESRKEA